MLPVLITIPKFAFVPFHRESGFFAVVSCANVGKLRSTNAVGMTIVESVFKWGFVFDFGSHPLVEFISCTIA